MISRTMTKKKDLYFTLEIHKYVPVDLLRTSKSYKTCSNHMWVCNKSGQFQKENTTKIAIWGYILQNMQSLVILCCCFAEEIYKNLNTHT